MKSLIVFGTALLSTAAPAFAREAKATICYDEALAYASQLAAEHKTVVHPGKLGSLDQIGDVQTEGWVFRTGKGGVLVLLGIADGTDGQDCRISVVYAE